MIIPFPNWRCCCEQLRFVALVVCAGCSSDEVAQSPGIGARGVAEVAGAGVQASSPSVVSAGSAGERAARAGIAGGGANLVAARGGSGAAASGGSGAAALGGSGAGASGRSGAAGEDGSSAAGRGGSSAAGQGGSGAAGHAAVPSAGCSKRAPRPANGTLMTNDRIITFPTTYDGMTPAPLLLALHAAGNPNTQLQRITQGSKLESDFVRAFPKSAGNAWVYNTDIDKVNGVLDALLAEYCIDERRIFATGHSSGAQMVVQMLCKGERRFRAVAPVAASKYCGELSPIPVLYIQGQMDAQRGGGNGEDVVRVFHAGNECADASAPLTSVASCTSSFDSQQVTPGCVTYEGCSVPTHWCSHNDNGYNNSDGRQHGWPCFANGAIADFFLGF